jgi:methylmalonyl-CoA/ethylmalonyl-CoA epimerase
MKIRRIAHVAVAAEQMEAMKAVFGGLFGMPLLKEARFESGTEMAMFQAGDMLLEVLHNASPTSLPGSFLQARGSGWYHICLEVEDLQQALAELAAKGVRTHPNSPRKAALSGTPVIFLDPATTGGLLIELAQAH